MGVAGHPLGHGGGSATPRSAGLGVAEPPPWPKGQPATPYGVVRPPLFFFLFFHRLKKGGSATPLGHGGDLATPDRPIWGRPNHPHGLGHPFKSMKKKKKEGWPNHPIGGGWHPLGHGGGSATPRPAGLGVAEPPPWPKGWPATPMRVVRPPLFFSFFFLILIYFIFKIKFLKNNILLVKNGAF
jgi:hypothetical protein